MIVADSRMDFRDDIRGILNSDVRIAVNRVMLDPRAMTRSESSQYRSTPHRIVLIDHSGLGHRSGCLPGMRADGLVAGSGYLRLAVTRTVYDFCYGYGDRRALSSKASGDHRSQDRYDAGYRRAGMDERSGVLGGRRTSSKSPRRAMGDRRARSKSPRRSESPRRAMGDRQARSKSPRRVKSPLRRAGQDSRTGVKRRAGPDSRTGVKRRAWSEWNRPTTSSGRL
jgi:hypothetical protein